jgi:hypothetical protein
MIEGFKNHRMNTEMRIQLFLLCRILMLRLPPQKLEETMRRLWPHLLSEMVSVFDKQPEDLDIGTLQLTFEGLKLIELMSQLNIEDF